MKIIKTILSAILILLLLLLLIVFVSDRILRKKELELLDENGYINKVSVGDYALNVYIYGSETPGHTVVGMSGKGVDDFSCTGKYVTDGLSDKNRIVYVDRAGYGLSDDTSAPQTVDTIINDYRTALKNAGVDAPYVLMPHSIAGPYAAYWASEYPDEIEGVFILDGSEINEDVFEYIDDVDFWGKFDIIWSEMGLGRVYIAIFEKDIRNYPKEEDADVSWALYNCRGPYTKAKYSEADLQIENMKDAWYKTQANDIPKMYICASYSAETVEDLRESLDYYNKINETSVSYSDEQLMKLLEAIKEFGHKDVDAFCEHIGKCEIRFIPGDHYIYCHKPEKVQECFKEFLETLDKIEN